MNTYAFHPLKTEDVPQIWQDLQASYARCGGHLKYPTPAALLTRRLWTCRLDPDSVQVIARPTRQGWKLSAVFGGTPCERWVHAARFVRTPEAPPWFCEFAPDLAEALGVHILTDPAEIQSFLPGKGLCFLGAGRYVREVSGRPVEKVLGVRPPVR